MCMHTCWHNIGEVDIGCVDVEGRRKVSQGEGREAVEELGAGLHANSCHVSNP